MSQKITALLPMKGHSERVSNKNMKPFCGRPLYHAVARVLLQSAFIGEVVVNTDSEAIKRDMTEFFPSFRINDRPDELIGDMVSMNAIIGYDVARSGNECFVQTHSTNPLLLAATLDRAIAHFIERKDKHDSLFSVTRLQSRLYWQDGSPINHNPEELLRTQDLPPVMEENSCFYVFTRESFRAAGSRRIGLKPCLYEIDKIESVDIDELEDFLIAEQLYRQFRITNEKYFP